MEGRIGWLAFACEKKIGPRQIAKPDRTDFHVSINLGHCAAARLGTSEYLPSLINSGFQMYEDQYGFRT